MRSSVNKELSITEFEPEDKAAEYELRANSSEFCRKCCRYRPDKLYFEDSLLLEFLKKHLSENKMS